MAYVAAKLGEAAQTQTSDGPTRPAEGFNANDLHAQSVQTGNGNVSGITQSGYYQQAFVEQVTSANTISVNQTGAYQLTYAKQTGNRNSAMVTQADGGISQP